MEENIMLPYMKNMKKFYTKTIKERLSNQLVWTEHLDNLLTELLDKDQTVGPIIEIKIIKQILVINLLEEQEMSDLAEKLKTADITVVFQIYNQLF